MSAGSRDEWEGRRTRLSTERIVDAAMHLARTDGLAGLSMRKLAGQLGVEAMSLYYDVPSKSALQVLMADRSATTILADSDGSLSWPEQLTQILMRTYRAGVDNPALFEVLAPQPLRQQDLRIGKSKAGSAVIALLEQIINLLREASLPAPQLVHTFRGLIGMIIGFTVVQVDGLPLMGEVDRADSAADGNRLAAPGPTLRDCDPAEGLEFNLQLILDGLLQLHPEPNGS